MFPALGIKDGEDRDTVGHQSVRDKNTERAAAGMTAWGRSIKKAPWEGHLSSSRDEQGLSSNLLVICWILINLWYLSYKNCFVTLN